MNEDILWRPGTPIPEMRQDTIEQGAISASVTHSYAVRPVTKFGVFYERIGTGIAPSTWTYVPLCVCDSEEQANAIAQALLKKAVTA